MTRQAKSIVLCMHVTEQGASLVTDISAELHLCKEEYERTVTARIKKQSGQITTLTTHSRAMLLLTIFFNLSRKSSTETNITSGSFFNSWNYGLDSSRLRQNSAQYNRATELNALISPDRSIFPASQFRGLHSR